MFVHTVIMVIEPHMKQGRQHKLISTIFLATSVTKKLDHNNIKVSTTTEAFQAMKSIDAAIETVSTYRATLGAAQNRLEHTVNNLKVTSENITSAESRIRDTDMADEITAYTKNNILLQAAQSMLSQSNAMPQGVLSMLQ